MSEPILPIEKMEALEGVVRAAVREALQEVLEERRESLREVISVAVRDALVALYTRHRDLESPTGLDRDSSTP